jgi:hypothetical protein
MKDIKLLNGLGPFGVSDFYGYEATNGISLSILSSATSGAYSLTITDENGVSGSASFNVIAPPAQQIILTMDRLAPQVMVLI